MIRSGRPLILFFLIFFCLNSFKSNATRLYGHITDENNLSLPYVIVYVSGTSNGTTANSEGLYSIELPNGSFEISFRMIGFFLLKKNVTINNEPVKLDILHTVDEPTSARYKQTAAFVACIRARVTTS